RPVLLNAIHLHPASLSTAPQYVSVSDNAEPVHTPTSISPVGVSTYKESSGPSHGQHHRDDFAPHPNMCRTGYSHEYLSDESRLCDSEVSYSTSHNCGANRERSAISTGSFPSIVKTPPSLSRLFTLAKSGDLEALKQLVKEGVDVNEQDERGRSHCAATY
ncbi:hypothetical protein AHF37_11517, partial [Paragonimus kellicotti]